MTRNGTNGSRASGLVAALDRFVYIKNGYSLWKHVVPFAVEALLLLVVSVPVISEENLIRQLVAVLDKPSWLWLPAGFLTVVAALVYAASMGSEIKQAYLLAAGDRRRTACTCALYVVSCTAIGYVVLRSVPPAETTLGVIWACLLLALLSLTGLGWSSPASWVESVGVSAPDYTDARLAATRVAEVLQRVRKQERSSVRDVEDFTSAVGKLNSSVEANLDKEPDWSAEQLRRIADDLRALLEETDRYLPTGRSAAVEDFATACRCQQPFHYGQFIAALRGLAKHWPDWACPGE